MKIDLSAYSAAGPIAARAAARAKTEAGATIFKTGPSRALLSDVTLIKRGRRSWREWWGERFRRGAKRKGHRSTA
jgi:hypothetical protein